MCKPHYSLLTISISEPGTISSRRPRRLLRAPLTTARLEIGTLTTSSSSERDDPPRPRPAVCASAARPRMMTLCPLVQLPYRNSCLVMHQMLLCTKGQCAGGQELLGRFGRKRVLSADEPSGLDVWSSLMQPITGFISTPTNPKYQKTADMRMRAARCERLHRPSRKRFNPASPETRREKPSISRVTAQLWCSHPFSKHGSSLS
jgi:hypothetical protein